MNNKALFFALTVFSFNFMAQAYAPKVGKAAAARYFQNERRSERGVAANEPQDEPVVRSSSSSSSSSNIGDHFMAFGFGTFSEGTAFNWGTNGRENEIGKWGADITYRMAEQEYLFDQALKISYSQYRPASEEASKLSFMYAVTFPEAGSRFPLYFGGAAGPGIFMKQIKDESQITLDYQLYLGLRVFNVFDSVGFFVEGGLRNHLNLTSDGQFNGTFLSLGTVFTF